MIAFIEGQRAVHGVEPICRVLPIAPSTYYEYAARRADPSRLPDRARSDADLQGKIRRVFDENFQVYGVRKIWRQLGREGEEVARCTVARLMKAMGLRGAIRGKPVRTTIPDKALPCPRDRVNRLFRANGPNMLWVVKRRSKLTPYVRPKLTPLGDGGGRRLRSGAARSFRIHVARRRSATACA